MQKVLTWLRKWRKRALVGILFFGVVLAVGAVISRIYQFWDDDPDRGATTVEQDIFGDKFSTVRYLDQGWKPADSLWFYNTTQGSDVMPYDFFMVLEQPGGTELLRSNENINRYRYLPRKATFANPDGLPVGFVKDSYKGKDYIGFTCAACHTGQVNYQGIGIRIDGGPAGADMDTFIHDLSAALVAATDNEDTRKRFVKNVLGRGSYRTEREVIDDLKKFSQRIGMYTVVNRSKTRYGYARLDAFGRIYNRVLEHLVTGRDLRKVFSELVAEKKMTQVEFEAILNDKYVSDVLNGNERDHIVERVTQALSLKQQLELRNKLFNPPDAPVSYPFLWDIPYHDYVQWNGLASNAGLGPIGRNAGEVVGVFGTLDWSEEPGFSLSSLISGQGLKAKHISFESSINVHNLRRIERHLNTLESPLWKDAPLPPIDVERAARGEHLFDSHCAECHAKIDRADPHRRVVAHISRVNEIGTDPVMAKHGAGYTGLSGILRNQYLSVGVGDILLDERAPAAALLTKATLSVVATPNPGKWLLRRGFDWAYDLVAAFFSNEIKASVKRGNYDPDTTENPFASVLSYKGRSLNGIWATAPYLHNGSVPTLYDLLLPKKGPDDPADGEYRPDTFLVGSRELDPVKVGLVSSGYDGFTFLTAREGNSNAGHEYPPRCTPKPEAVCPPTMTKEDRLDLVEYLKSL